MKRQENGGSWQFGRRALPLVVGALIVSLSGCSTLDEGHHHYHPEVSVPDGHEQVFRLSAVGVQIYAWTGTNWSFRAPEAVLYDANHQPAGKHYKGADGPVWEATDGSMVAGKMVTKADAYNSNSIPHLLLEVVSSSQQGAFSRITYIQRVDTVGGIAPTDPGVSEGQESRVKYHAEYVFYRKRK